MIDPFAAMSAAMSAAPQHDELGKAIALVRGQDPFEPVFFRANGTTVPRYKSILAELHLIEQARKP